MGLLDRDYMKEPNKPSKRRKAKAIQPNPKTTKPNPKISGQTKKQAMDSLINGTPIQPSKPSLFKRLFKPLK
jgi:hypothetical protein